MHHVWLDWVAHDGPVTLVSQQDAGPLIKTYSIVFSVQSVSHCLVKHDAFRH